MLKINKRIQLFLFLATSIFVFFFHTQNVQAAPRTYDCDYHTQNGCVLLPGGCTDPNCSIPSPNVCQNFTGGSIACTMQTNNPCDCPLYTTINNPAIGSTLSGFRPTEFFQELVGLVITAIFVVGALYFLIILLSGSIQWITAGGDKGAIESARNKVRDAFLGIIILLSLFAFISLVEFIFSTNIRSFDIGSLSIRSSQSTPVSCNTVAGGCVNSSDCSSGTICCNNVPVPPPGCTGACLPTGACASLSNITLPTSTPGPTNTPFPTNTPVPTPTNTPIPLPTSTPVPTSTPIPTNTPVPTNTPIPTPTTDPRILACQSSGGTWKFFASCHADFCSSFSCAGTVNSCDCGANSCWDNSTCLPNPTATPVPSVPTVILNSQTGLSCTDLCISLGFNQCLSTGVDASATSGNYVNFIPAPGVGCVYASSSCSTTMNSNGNCGGSGHLAYWTNCLCN